MSELKTVIQLHSIRITSLTNPHDDLPGDMKMFAQLIVEENIFVQTLPLASEHDQISWKLGFGCNMRDEILGSVDSPHRLRNINEDDNVAFRLELNKVNPDGPTLKLSARFSVSNFSDQKVSGLDLIGMPEDTVASVKCHRMERELQRMYEDSRKTQFSMNALQLSVMHERILLCYQSNNNRARLLNILGDILFQPDQGSGTVDNLNQAVCAYGDAVRDDPEDFIYLADLGTSLLRCFGQLGDLDDLNQSVLRLEAAVALTPDGHPDKPSMLNNRGISLCSRFQRLGDLHDLNQSVLRLEAAVALTPDGHPDKPSQLNNLGNSLLSHFDRLGDLQDALKAAGQVVRDAASAAIAAHDYQKAVEWLDQGRSVIWGQLLNLRTPVDELRKINPDLANRLVSLSNSLETAGTQTNAVSEAIKPQSIAQRCHALALERNRVLEQIRELPDFERFLLSKPISKLSLAANMGPVAILNISEYGTDALILLPGLGDEVIHVAPHNFTIHEVQALAESLTSIVGNTGRTDRFSVSREEDMTPDEIFSFILSELWSKMVQPVLNAIAITTPANQDWDVSGGVQQGHSYFSLSMQQDFMELRLLAVSQPSAQGQSYIPGTQEEIKCVQTHLAEKVPVQWLDKDMAAIDTVQQGMKDSRWVHFACHGVQSTSPTESALLLAGHSRLTLSSIINLSLPNVDLAFLSTCQTATGSKELQDESVHLAAGMLLAGYRGVIGTMWSIGTMMPHKLLVMFMLIYWRHHPQIRQGQLKRYTSLSGSFKTSLEQRIHFYAGFPSYILGFNLWDTTARI
ncbi:CHAT domain-containing protein [Mycena sanguinolenta]|nr:CHAT domain-containing protein [Mycena sanguinolenta]